MDGDSRRGSDSGSSGIDFGWSWMTSAAAASA